jgi:hypothetical protein
LAVSNGAPAACPRWQYKDHFHCDNIASFALFVKRIMPNALKAYRGSSLYRFAQCWAGLALVNPER